MITVIWGTIKVNNLFKFKLIINYFINHFNFIFFYFFGFNQDNENDNTIEKKEPEDYDHPIIYYKIEKV